MFDWFTKKSSLSKKRPVKFLGWIIGKESDRLTLVQLGVKGEMKFTKTEHSMATMDEGIFEMCEITMQVAKSLCDNFPPFFPSPFTGVDEDGRQTEHQPLRNGVYE